MSKERYRERQIKNCMSVTHDIRGNELYANFSYFPCADRDSNTGGGDRCQTAKPMGQQPFLHFDKKVVDMYCKLFFVWCAVGDFSAFW